MRRASWASTSRRSSSRGLLDGCADRAGGDLVEDHAMHRHPRREHLDEVPGDGLALAVLVCGQVDLARIREQALQLGDLLLLLAAHDVERLEVVVDVDAEAGPRLLLERGRDVGGGAGKVTDVPDRGLDDIVAAEKARDGLRFCRRLDDHEWFGHVWFSTARVGTTCCGLLTRLTLCEWCAPHGTSWRRPMPSPSCRRAPSRGTSTLRPPRARPPGSMSSPSPTRASRRGWRRRGRRSRHLRSQSGHRCGEA